MSTKLNYLFIAALGVATVTTSTLYISERTKHEVDNANNALEYESLQNAYAKLDEDFQQLEISRDYYMTTLDAYLNADPTDFEYELEATPLHDLPLSDDLQAYTYALCESYDIVEYYDIILAQMWQESNFKEDVISRTDDYGLMQINKCVHNSLSDVLGINNFLDPKSNILAGVYIMSDLLHKYDDVNRALMSYNMGQYRATQLYESGVTSSNYSRSILARSQQLDEYYGSN